MADYQAEYTEAERRLLEVMRLNPNARWADVAMAVGMNPRRAMFLWRRIKAKRPGISPRELLQGL